MKNTSGSNWSGRAPVLISAPAGVGDVSSQERAQVAFGSAVILLLLGEVATYATITRLLIAQQRFSHTHEVQVALADINLVLGKARRAQIDYGDPNFLRAYESAAGQVSGVLQHIRQLIADNPTQGDNCARLESLVGRRMGMLANSVELRKKGEFGLWGRVLNYLDRTRTVMNFRWRYSNSNRHNRQGVRVIALTSCLPLVSLHGPLSSGCLRNVRRHCH